VCPGSRITIIDHGVGLRTREFDAGDWSASVQLLGSTYSRRVYRSSNQKQAYAAARLGLATIHPLLRRLREFDAILDISGGDSFSDIYGAWRFRAVSAPKKLALALGLPLVLMPQTYGPFEDPRWRTDARRLMLGARQLWARDERSLAVAEEILGADFDPTRHRRGVDVAFGLPIREPGDRAVVESVRSFAASGGPVIGLNVSGLLYNAREHGRPGFNFRVHYSELMLSLLQELLSRGSNRVMLIPHVAPPCTPEEDDYVACRALYSRLAPELRERVLAVSPVRDPMEAKWVIGHCEWFCGTRMHSCIAGLSQGIPTAAVAYSDKSLGVFETVASGAFVFDPRRADAEALVPRIVESVEQRHEMRERLEAALEEVRSQWHDQFQEIVRVAQGSASMRAVRRR
jgi:polysaccharide pyruvyl transferase WcaK-like protein